MKQFLAIAIYRCRVDGQPSGSLDLQVRLYVAESADEVRERVTREGGHSYENSDGEQVVWEFREIMAVEEFAAAESGAELIGFVAGIDELRKLA